MLNVQEIRSLYAEAVGAPNDALPRLGVAASLDALRANVVAIVCELLSALDVARAARRGLERDRDNARIDCDGMLRRLVDETAELRRVAAHHATSARRKRAVVEKARALRIADADLTSASEALNSAMRSHAWTHDREHFEAEFARAAMTRGQCVRALADALAAHDAGEVAR